MASTWSTTLVGGDEVDGLHDAVLVVGCRRGAVPVVRRAELVRHGGIVGRRPPARRRGPCPTFPAMETTPFRIEVPDADLDDLRRRVTATRWPDQLPGFGWSLRDGPGRAAAPGRVLGDAYDWRAHEAELNAFPQFTTTIDGQRIHFLHVRSPEPGALPLILTHGWPGSIVEFTRPHRPAHRPRRPRRRRPRTPSTWSCRPCPATGSRGRPRPRVGRAPDRRRLRRADGRGSGTTATAPRAATGAR